MNEKYVVSLELAKKMKELGFRQESDFKWGIGGDQCEKEWTLLSTHDDSWSATDVIAAFHVGELGEMLVKTKLRIDYWHSYPDWRLKLSDNVDTQAREELEANARVQMLIYLAENKLIDPTKL